MSAEVEAEADSGLATRRGAARAKVAAGAEAAANPRVEIRDLVEMVGLRGHRAARDALARVARVMGKAAGLAPRRPVAGCDAKRLARRAWLRG